MKIIKKIFLAIVMLFAFASCMSSPINLTGSAAPISPSQKKGSCSILTLNIQENGEVIQKLVLDLENGRLMKQVSGKLKKLILEKEMKLS